MKFDSFQRPLSTFSFVAVSSNCLFLSKFQVFLSVLAQVWGKMFLSEIKFVLLLGHELFLSSFQCALPVFDVFDQVSVFVLLGRICRFQATSFN